MLNWIFCGTVERHIYNIVVESFWCFFFLDFCVFLRTFQILFNANSFCSTHTRCKQHKLRENIVEIFEFMKFMMGAKSVWQRFLDSDYNVMENWKNFRQWQRLLLAGVANRWKFYLCMIDEIICFLSLEFLLNIQQMNLQARKHPH